MGKDPKPKYSLQKQKQKQKQKQTKQNQRPTFDAWRELKHFKPDI